VEGIKYGVRKVNIDTDIRLAMTAAMRKAMADKPDEFDPRAFLKAATSAAKKVVKDRFESFGCAGQASKIKALHLDHMASLYQKGSLRAKVH
jgi:fructose-bisphosphate aldolase class II